MKQEVYGIHLTKLNVAFLGIGGMGQLHLANCAFMGKMNIIAVADKSKNLLKKAELYKVKNFYEDYIELLFDKLIKLFVMTYCPFAYVQFNNV